MEIEEPNKDLAISDSSSMENEQEGETPEAEPEQQSLSKNQLKKLRKRERWLEIKQLKRKEAKSKRKERLAEMRRKGETIGPTRKKLKLNTMKDSGCKIRVALDLSLEEYMAEKDLASLTSQIQFSYSANRRAENPMQLYICGLSGKTKKRLDDVGDYKGWDIHVEERDFNEVFPKESIVYLSSESPNVLSTLSEDKVYVIGGLVDHNSQKGLCHRLAVEKNVSHAQLPISDYLALKGRKVLAVNHVFSILLRYTELEDWKQAFLLEMPTRKGFSLKDEGPGDTLGSSNGKEEKCPEITSEEKGNEEKKSIRENVDETNKEEDINRGDQDNSEEVNKEGEVNSVSDNVSKEEEKS